MSRPEFARPRYMTPARLREHRAQARRSPVLVWHRNRVFSDTAVTVLVILTIANAIFTVYFSPSRRRK